MLRGLRIINIGGQKRPIKFGVNFTALFMEQRGCDIEGLNKALLSLVQKTNNPADIRDIFYNALRAGALSKGLEVDFNEYSVGDWLDELKPEDVKTMHEALAESLPKENKSDNNDKKKV